MPSAVSTMALPDRRAGAAPRRYGAGFTMVELVVVMVLIGILAAVGAARFYTRTAYDVSAYAEQVRAMARYAQKLAIAQNRNVYMVGSPDVFALCYANALPCPTNRLVVAPAGANSGNANTRTYCVTGGAYAANWYCEGRPSNVTMTPASGMQSGFYFNGLGKPYLPGDLPTTAGAPSQNSSFATTAFTFSGDGASFTVTISPETGYVY
jgi:MSHA pilin protein MshC